MVIRACVGMERGFCCVTLGGAGMKCKGEFYIGYVRSSTATGIDSSGVPL